MAINISATAAACLRGRLAIIRELSLIARYSNDNEDARTRIRYRGPAGYQKS
jgi:hypothetical protein